VPYQGQTGSPDARCLAAGLHANIFLDDIPKGGHGAVRQREACVQRILPAPPIVARSEPALSGGHGGVRLLEDPRFMAFDPRNLGVLAYAGGFSLWQYRSTSDGAATIASPGHMDPVAAMLRPDDLVLVSAPDRGLILRIVSLTGGSVTTAELASGPPPEAQAAPSPGAILDAAGAALLTEAGEELLVE
jgi:hypothetical protein